MYAVEEELKLLFRLESLFGKLCTMEKLPE
jgi:hypothetical protein